MRKPLLRFASPLALGLLLGACSPNVESSGGVITAAQLAERIGADSAPLVLDVRSRDEYTQGHIPGAVNIPHDELFERLAELPIEKSEEVVVHCKSGRRAGMAEEVLSESGYSNVRNLSGHWEGWQQAGLPTE
jgi:phage shock protein E